MTLDRRYYSELAKDIPVILLAGGLGTRLSEETQQIPKPMVKIAGVPIVLHIMDYYAKFGFRKFLICGGYRIEAFKEFFLQLPYAGRDLEITFAEGGHSSVATPSAHFSDPRLDWQVTVLETGLHAMTGARVSKAVQHLKKKGFSRFALTYGDGVADADLHQELAFHLQHKKVGTVLGVHQPTRFGIFKLQEDGKIAQFLEKPQFSNEFINGGYFIFESGLENYLDQRDEQSIFEQSPLSRMTEAGDLYVYRHEGYWQCMDTMREKNLLEELATQGRAPWLNVRV